MEKRYAEHDALPVESTAHAGPQSGHEVTMTCARCGCSATGRAREKLTAVYSALVTLEGLPCALVAIDERGYPTAVVDDVVLAARAGSSPRQQVPVAA